MAQASPGTPIISVVVATRNRRELLRQFLTAMRLVPDQPAWELIVVDNGSDDGTDSLLATSAADLPLVVVNEKLPGKSRAINKGLKQAQGDLIVFTDDDAVPNPDWLVALHHASLEYPSAKVFGGRILVNYDRIPNWIVHSSNLKTLLVSEQDLGDALCWFAKDQYPIGPNLAVRRRLLDQGSLVWPVNLGPGTKIPVGDERAFLTQLSSPLACDRLYVPGSIVRHTIGGRQLNIASALVRCFLGGYAAGLIGRARDSSRARDAESVLSIAGRRLFRTSSVRELTCAGARALGVLVGATGPFDRTLHG